MGVFLENLDQVVGWLDAKIVWVLIPALLGTGVLLTVRLRFVQISRLWHGVLVTVGYYDKGDHPGDVSHFAALSTALGATVGVGNIAGVALAIHYGGPGALFWMWVTAFLGMAVKFTECTLAVQYRDTLHGDARAGGVSGGPMYYIEKGLKMKPLAYFFAVALMVTSFFTGNAIQANTLADVLNASFGWPFWATGLVSAVVVGAVILGGIGRIGKITSVMAPAMAFIYVTGAVGILILRRDQILPAFASIFTQAFDPVASATGVGVGSMLAVMVMGVKRGLFSNEAGQGSAPCAHAAARTDEPVSEGVVALLEPFIDTICICTLTGLVLLTTNVWDERFPQTIDLSAATWASDVTQIDDGVVPAEAMRYNDGWVENLYVDADHATPFHGVVSLQPEGAQAVDLEGHHYAHLYGHAVDLGAPLTSRAFARGLAPLTGSGDLIVALCVVLFALSTAISWSYYGDRCAMYLIGEKAILPYRLVYCVMHFVGATVPLAAIWHIGDVSLSLGTIPNVIALVLLSGGVSKATKSYFARKAYAAPSRSDETMAA